MPDDLLLDFGKCQARDVDVSIEAERNLAVGTNQTLAGNGPARKGLEYFDEQHVGRFDDIIPQTDKRGLGLGLRFLRGRPESRRATAATLSGRA